MMQHVNPLLHLHVDRGSGCCSRTVTTPGLSSTVWRRYLLSRTMSIRNFVCGSLRAQIHVRSPSTCFTSA